MSRRPTIKFLAVLALTAFMSAGCSRAADRQAGGVLRSPAVQEAGGKAEGAAGLAADSAAPAPTGRVGAPGAQPPLPELPQVTAKVIKTAEVEIRVGAGEFQRKFSRAGSVAEELGGFVTGSSVEETKGKVSSGIVTLRVPSDRFQAALSALRGIGTVTRELQQGQDVTRQFVDLEARLRHAKSQEAFYLRLMDQAKTVEEMIRIQEGLASVQLRIEELEGQLQYLRDHTSLSTISARIFEPGAGAEKPKTGLARAWREAVEAFQRVVGGLIVALGWLAPFALLGLAGFAGWRISRAKPAAQTPPAA